MKRTILQQKKQIYKLNDHYVHYEKYKKENIKLHDKLAEESEKYQTELQIMQHIQAEITKLRKENDLLKKESMPVVPSNNQSNHTEKKVSNNSNMIVPQMVNCHKQPSAYSGSNKLVDGTNKSAANNLQAVRHVSHAGSNANSASFNLNLSVSDSED